MLAVGLLHFGWLPCPKVGRGDRNAKPGAFFKLHVATKGATMLHILIHLYHHDLTPLSHSLRLEISLHVLYYVLSLPEKVDPLPTLTVERHCLCYGQSESSLLPNRGVRLSFTYASFHFRLIPLGGCAGET
jgi:hypothetical protein